MGSKLNKKVCIQGLRLKQCRENVKMSQKDLAEKACYTPVYISNLETGKKTMSVEAAKKCAEVLGVRYEYLLGRDDIKTEREYYEKKDSLSSEFRALMETSFILKTGYHCALELYNDIPEKRTDNSHVEINGYILSAPDIDYDYERLFYISFDDAQNVLHEVSDFLAFKLEQLRRSNEIDLELLDFYRFQDDISNEPNFPPTIQGFKEFKAWKGKKGNL